VATTEIWKGEPPRPLPGGPIADSRRAVFAPVIDLVPRWHGWLYAPRVLEPEVMDEGDEAEAYMDAAAHEHLAALDASWVESVVAFGPRGAAQVLDVGTGGGQIPAALAGRRPTWRIWAVDRARSMLAAGREPLVAARQAARQMARPFGLALAEADARRLPFPDNTFDLVISNSLLHHLADPSPVLDEIARVAGGRGRVLIRDLRRPPRWRRRLHVAWHGRHYRGTMRRLYEDSVAAAFTPTELATILRHTALAGASVRPEGPYLLMEQT
jgi:ubiquinone/menaquinone biosynthesis C-methylase UbiE